MDYSRRTRVIICLIYPVSLVSIITSDTLDSEYFINKLAFHFYNTLIFQHYESKEIRIAKIMEHWYPGKWSAKIGICLNMVFGEKKEAILFIR